MKGTIHYVRKTPGFKDFDMIEVGIDVEFEGDKEAMEKAWQQIYKEVENKLPRHAYSDLVDTDQELESEDMTIPIGQSLIGSTVEEAWPGKYISAKYLMAKGPLLLTITDVRKEMLRTNFGDKREAPKDVIYFKETKLTLPRGPGGSAQMADAIGSSAYADWLGVKVQLVPFHLKTGKDTVRAHLPNKVPNWNDGYIIKKSAPASPQKQQEPDPAPVGKSAPASPQKQPEHKLNSHVTWEGVKQTHATLVSNSIELEPLPDAMDAQELAYAMMELKQIQTIYNGQIPNDPLFPQALRYLIQKYSYELTQNKPELGAGIGERDTKILAAKLGEAITRPVPTGISAADGALLASEEREHVEIARHGILRYLFATESTKDLSIAEGKVLLRRLLEDTEKEFKSPIKELAVREFGNLRNNLETNGLITYSTEEAEEEPDAGMDDIPF